MSSLFKKKTASGNQYQIRVHVIEAQDLQAKDDSGTSDPVPIVEMFGQKQSGPIEERTFNAYWDHLMYFEYKGTERNLMGESIRLAVYDANKLLKNELIGEFSVDVSYVLEQDDHEVYYVWAPLMHPEFDGVQGMLNFSITVIPPGKEPPKHKDSDIPTEKVVLVNPELGQEGHLLTVEFFKAENLPVMDQGLTGGAIDAYFKILFGNDGEETPRTETVKNDLNPTINQEVNIPLYEPIMRDSISVQLWDEDTPKDEHVCNLEFSYRDVKAHRWDIPRWVNLYGSPTSKSNSKQHKAMLSGSVDPSAWCGRVLLKLSESPVGEPEYSRGEAKTVAEEPRNDIYQLHFDLYQIVDCWSDYNDKIYLTVSMGPDVLTSTVIKAEHGRAEWYQPLKSLLLLAYPDEFDQVPDIFINLYAKKKTKEDVRIGYLRIKPEEVMRYSYAKMPRWQMLWADKASPGFKDGAIPGFLQYRMTFGLKRDLPDPSKRPEIDVPSTAKYIVRTYLYQARDLPGADAGGTSDPYVVVRLAGQKVKSEVVEKTLFPQWYQVMDMEVELPDNLAYAPDINIMLYDWDQFGKDDVLGWCFFPMRKATEKAPERPKWRSLHMENKSDTVGSILVAFQVFPESKATLYPVPESIHPSYKECTFQIQCIGLRGMEPVQMLPCQQPYMEFDLCDRTADGFVATKPSKLPNPSNPNFLETLEIPCMIPEDPLYAPTINVTVYDSRLGGLVKPKAGSTSIPMLHFMSWVDAENYVEEVASDDELEDDDGKPNRGARGAASDDGSDSDDDTRTARDIYADPLDFALPAHYFDDGNEVDLDNLQALEDMSFSSIDMDTDMNDGVSAHSDDDVEDLEEDEEVEEVEVELDEYEDEEVTEKEVADGEVVVQEVEEVVEVVEEEVEDEEGNTVAVQETVTEAEVTEEIVEVIVEEEEEEVDPEELAEDEDEAEEVVEEIVEEVVEEDDEELEEEEEEPHEDEEPDPEFVATVNGESTTNNGNNADEAEEVPVEEIVEEVIEVIDEMNKEEGGEDGEDDGVEGTGDEVAIDMPAEDEGEAEAAGTGAADQGASSQQEGNTNAAVAGQAGMAVDANAAAAAATQDTSDAAKAQANQVNGAPAAAVVDGEPVDGKTLPEIEEEAEDEEAEYIDPSDPVENRVKLQHELEQSFTRRPFHVYDLFRGQTHGLSSTEKALGLGKRKKVGVFKGNFRLQVRGQAGGPKVDLKKVFRPEVYKVRVYVVRCMKLKQMDADSPSDPFIEVKVGDKANQCIYDSDNYFLDNPNPQVYKMYEVEATIPGNNRLEVNVWDWDQLGANDLIGGTVIDLEDRVFNTEWLDLDKKPREIRGLYAPTSLAPQGEIDMWVDVVKRSEAGKVPVVRIEPPKPVVYELRLVIWDVKEFSIMDPIQGSSDVYVTVKFQRDDDDKAQSTDVHWKAKKEALFNWRMVFPVELPHELPRLKVQVWDKDYIGASDNIGELIVDLRKHFKKARKTRRRVDIAKKGTWLLTHPNKRDGHTAKVRYDMYMLPEDEAVGDPVGFGLQEPNNSPKLEPPNRPPDSINPMRMDLLIAYYGKKSIKYIIAIVCIVIIGYVLQFVFTVAGAFN